MDHDDASDSSELSSPPSDLEETVQTLPIKPSKKRAAPRTIQQSSPRKRAKPSVDLAPAPEREEDVDNVQNTSNTPKKAKVVKRKASAGQKEVIAETEADDIGAFIEEKTTIKTKSPRRQTAKKSKVKQETETIIDIEVAEEKTEVKTNGHTKKTRESPVKQETTELPEDLLNPTSSTPKKQRKSKKAKLSVNADPTDDEKLPEDKEQAPAKVKRKRKTAEEKALEAMPLAARTLSPKILIGAHVSAAGGVHNAVTAANHIGGNAFALFLKSQRKWENPALKPEHSEQFRTLCGEHKYASDQHVVPHGSYLVNLAVKDAARKKQAYDVFFDDLKRCESLGIQLYNFHPGNTLGEQRDEAIARLAERLNEAHAETKTVVTLLENMAARPEGNVIGSTFADLRDVISLVHDKARVGVCLDTCHAFAAGYDLRSPAAFSATLADFDATIGLKYLRAMHINDSKAPFASHRDLHANIGTGFLGLRAFHNVVNEPRLMGLPLVLETPIEMKDEMTGKTIEDKGVWAREIKLLESLVSMDPDGEEFLKLERELAEKGQVEREKYQEQFERLEKERARKAAGGGRKRKGKKKGVVESVSESADSAAESSDADEKD